MRKRPRVAPIKTKIQVALSISSKFEFSIWIVSFPDELDSVGLIFPFVVLVLVGGW